jgi:hypothetical protein
MVSMDKKAKAPHSAYRTALIICTVLNLAMLFKEVLGISLKSGN